MDAVYKISDLPFNQFIGIETLENGEVKLQLKDHHTNHIGTAHAAVLYNVAESATGQWIIDNIMNVYPDAFIVCRTGQIKYKSPAKEFLKARVVKVEPAAQDVLARLQTKGVAKILMEVEVDDASGLACTASFEWFKKLVSCP